MSGLLPREIVSFQARKSANLTIKDVRRLEVLQVEQWQIGKTRRLLEAWEYG